MAYSIYDLLRSNWNYNKTWQYYIAVNRMAATTSLLDATWMPIHSARDIRQTSLIKYFIYLCIRI